MSIDKAYNNWRLATDENKILWLCFDKADSALNTIDRDVMEEFSDVIAMLEKPNDYKALVIASAKSTGFIAGADISQFGTFKNVEEATEILKLGQDILNRLEKLSIPSIAMIDGFCLGGGLELALACTYRIAENSPKTRLGLPEVKLGIHPGWGGTVRLPRLIGAMEGLNMILSGHTVDGKKAKRLGFVDEAVPKRQLVNAATYYALKKPNPHQASFLQRMSNKKFARQIISHLVRKKLRKKIHQNHYPAPFLALDNFEMVGVNSKKSYAREAKTCGRLFLSETSENLVRVFFLQEKMKGLAKKSDYQPKHVHVIGAGTMGGDIASWCAMRGFTVTLQDLKPEYIAPAIKRAHKLYKKKLKEPHLVTQAMDRLIPDLKGIGVGKADIIIEAVVEDLKIKQNLFNELERKAKPDAILATNTSSIPLDEINQALINPGRLVGIHFFNPVAQMQLVEVVKGEKTKEDVLEKAISFVRQIDRLPLPVKSSPGFLVNRILMPYLLEAMDLLNEGVPAGAIDKAMKDFGMPMGPITLADTVGLDVCMSVANYLSQYFNSSVPDELKKMVEKKKLGRKSGMGFYEYDKNGKQIKPQYQYNKPLSEISDRLVLRMLNEAFACLREGVVTDDDLLDAGMVYGTGFAPFRGGPIHYAKTQGINELYEQYVLQQQAKSGGKETVDEWKLTEV